MIDHHRFPELVGGLGGELQLNGIHGTPSYAKTAGFAGFRGDLDLVIGFVHALFEIQLMKRLEIRTVFQVAISEGIRLVLMVHQTVNQAGIGGLFQYLDGFFFCDFSSHIVFNAVPSQFVKV